MSVPNSIVKLVKRFDENTSVYRSDHYNETPVRREFIDPFFEALGWDIDNSQDNSEAYKDVIHEDLIKIAGAPKKPDYSFRCGGIRQLFVEAKKPYINIQNDSSSSFQLRRYGWSAKLPISVLTNFAELVIYDCRVKPSRDDSASVARTEYFTYTDYLEKWDQIALLLSKEAVMYGALDKYADSLKTQKGIATVDAAFLKEIETWRELLAYDVASKNPQLTQRELNSSVQITIDRIIFLRICEDRGIEPYGKLQSLHALHHVYGELSKIFREADDRYNSGLFHFHNEAGRSDDLDTFSLDLTISDEPLKKIIKSLYYPDSPYEFSVLPADILGQVYEQFLGKVIRLENGRNAIIEEKAEVRKSGGVFYTPTYIVDYMVHRTLGKLVEGKTPKQVASLKILDPACGSGSFLIAAYQFLLDWHREYYIQEGAGKYKKQIYQSFGGAWHLSTDERKRVLLNNIYGVDIDTQAVEVTKLSLLLKILEGESEQTLATQLQMFHERALPDLSHNIKCGNSLIGSDFYEITQMSFLDEEEQYRINTFDWNVEYAEIMLSGGFDVVIGNPPYIFGEYLNQNAKQYFHKEFDLAQNQYDTYWLFIEQSLKLTKNSGRFALIVPDALLARDEAEGVRVKLLTNGLDSIYHCGTVFKASVSTVVFTVIKGALPKEILSEVRDRTTAIVEHACSRQRFELDPHHKFLVHASDQEADLLFKIEQACKSLDNWVRISRGEEIGKKSVLSEGSIPIIVGYDISRYYIAPPSRFVVNVAKDLKLYQSPKIVVVKTGDQCIAALDHKGLVTMQSVYNLHVILDQVMYEAILALLNSRLIRCYTYKTFTAYKHLFPQLNQTTIQSIPIPLEICKKQEPLVELVHHISSLFEKLSHCKTSHDKTFIERQIDIVNLQIDRLVYGIYGLTEQEIKVIEIGVPQS